MENKEKVNIYEEILAGLDSLLSSKPKLELITIYSNLVVILKEKFKDISWVGFYLFNDKRDGLILGSFAGPLACNYIDINKGVCGESARNEKTIIVKDVTKIPYHIACDSLSRSEIVVPFFMKNTIVSVLDLDSHSFSSFDEVDKKYLELILSVVSNYLK